MTKPEIILVGAGGHCRSCVDVIEQEGQFDILGIVDKSGQYLLRLAVEEGGWISCGGPEVPTLGINSSRDWKVIKL